MKSLLYEQILQLSLDLVNASVAEDKETHWAAYNKLHLLCTSNKATALDHPMQWEALGDFSHKPSKALECYGYALQLAQTTGPSEYIASISFACAERHLELGENRRALELATAALEHANSADQINIRSDISEFIIGLSNSSHHIETNDKVMRIDPDEEIDEGGIEWGG